MNIKFKIVLQKDPSNTRFTIIRCGWGEGLTPFYGKLIKKKLSVSFSKKIFYFYKGYKDYRITFLGVNIHYICL